MPNCGAFGSGPMLRPRSSRMMFGKAPRPGKVWLPAGKFCDERRKAPRNSLIRFDEKLCSIVAEKRRCLDGTAVKKTGRFAAVSMSEPLVIVKRKRNCVAGLWM